MDLNILSHSTRTAGYGLNLLIGNVDISADPENIWMFENGERTDANPEGYVWFRPYPDVVDELDANGSPTGLKEQATGGILRVQLKHGIDDKIYVRIAHASTGGQAQIYADLATAIEAAAWIDADTIDADHDRRPIPSDQFPLDTTEWIDQDADGLGYNTEHSSTTYHTAQELWHVVSGSWESTFVFGQGGTKTYTVQTSDYNPDFDGDGALDGIDLFPKDPRRTQDSHGLHLGINHHPYSLNLLSSYNFFRFYQFNHPDPNDGGYRYVKPKHPDSWDDKKAAWDALGTGYLDNNPYFIPSTGDSLLMWENGENALSQSFGFGDFITLDLSQEATYRFDMFAADQYPADGILMNTTYLVAYSGSLKAAQEKNYLFTNNLVSSSAMDQYYHWTHDESTGIDHGGSEYINFDTAIGGQFAATQNLHLLTDYTGMSNYENSALHPSPNGWINPRYNFYLHIPGDGTNFTMIADMFKLDHNGTGRYSTYLQKHDALDDFMFEQDSSGDLMLKENPAQQNGTFDFDLDAQGDLQLTA